MPNLNKIDPQIWDKVFTYSNKDLKIDCLVWLFDNTKKPKFNQFCHFYPFINAVGVCDSYKNILSLSEFETVRYISCAKTTAKVYLNRVCNFVESQTLFRAGLGGNGVCVAVLDTGCSPHLDLVLGKNRIKKFVDFLNKKEHCYDDNGHGTFVCGVVAGNGLLSNTKYHGIAPKSELVVLKALDQNGETQVFTILDAMQCDIKVCCMSF